MPLISAPVLAATTIIITYGDDDCFGEAEINCSNGAFPVIPSFDNASILDPLGTDHFTNLGVVTFDFVLGIALQPNEQIVSVTVDTRVAGVDIAIPSTGGDPVEGMGFTFNSTFLGSYFEPIVIASDINQRTIADLVFDVAPSDLNLNGSNLFTLTPELDFGLLTAEFYAIDFARLTISKRIVTTPPPRIPLPAALPLLAGGLALLWGARLVSAPRNR